jgi:hypothetical protein
MKLQSVRWVIIVPKARYRLSNTLAHQACSGTQQGRFLKRDALHALLANIAHSTDKTNLPVLAVQVIFVRAAHLRFNLSLTRTHRPPVCALPDRTVQKEPRTLSIVQLARSAMLLA